MSKVAVIGAGYVGLTTAACLADLGNDVTVVDVDREKVEQLTRNQVPFYEPGMTELVKRNAESKRLRFTTSYADAIPGAEYAIIAVSTPEVVKYASNAFLAARISFINEIARICERVDADAKLVAEGMGMDKRIGPTYLDAGIGYGGSCFPKDVKALAALAERFDYHPELLHAVMDINRDQRMLVIDKLRECLGTLNQKVVGLLGRAFKPNTDALREE